MNLKEVLEQTKFVNQKLCELYLDKEDYPFFLDKDFKKDSKKSKLIWKKYRNRILLGMDKGALYDYDYNNNPYKEIADKRKQEKSIYGFSK